MENCKTCTEMFLHVSNINLWFLSNFRKLEKIVLGMALKLDFGVVSGTRFYNGCLVGVQIHVKLTGNGWKTKMFCFVMVLRVWSCVLENFKDYLQVFLTHGIH